MAGVRCWAKLGPIDTAFWRERESKGNHGRASGLWLVETQHQARRNYGASRWHEDNDNAFIMIEAIMVARRQKKEIEPRQSLSQNKEVDEVDTGKTPESREERSHSARLLKSWGYPKAGAGVRLVIGSKSFVSFACVRLPFGFYPTCLATLWMAHHGGGCVEKR